MLLHHSVALGESDIAREPPAELAKRLPVAVAHQAEIDVRLARGPFAEVELTHAREVGGERLRRHLSRLAVDPDRALAVLEGVVNAVDEVPGNRAAILGAADARRPAPGGVARVVAGGLVDEAVVAVELEGAAGYADLAAHGHAGLLARPDPAAPMRRDDLDALALAQLQLDRHVRLRATLVDTDPAAALEQRSVRQRHRPPALAHAGHARVADAQHHVGAVDADVTPPLQG